MVLLKKSGVDLANGVITLTKTKSNKIRRIYINKALAGVLQKAMANSRGDFVFTNRQGQPYTTDGVRCLFRRAVENAKIQDFHFHDLRHTTATRIRRAGRGLDEIAHVLGHATLAMSQRYAHLGSDTLKAAMGTLPAPVKPTKPVKATSAAARARRAGRAVRLPFGFHRHRVISHGRAIIGEKAE